MTDEVQSEAANSCAWGVSHGFVFSSSAAADRSGGALGEEGGRDKRAGEQDGGDEEMRSAAAAASHIFFNIGSSWSKRGRLPTSSDWQSYTYIRI